MPLWSRSVTAEPTRHRAVVGSARRINLGRRNEVEKLRLRHSLPAQTLAWKHYDAIGEVKYAFNYVANILSRIRLYAAYVPDDRDGPPVPIGSIGSLDRDLVTSARYEVAKLDTAHGGQPGLIRNFALNYQVAGECFLIEVDDRLGIYSSEELHVEGTPAKAGQERRSSGIYLQPRRDMQTQERIPLSEDTFMARIWRQHPAYSDEPDSSLFGVAESAEELLMLGRSIRASAMSQINAGILYVAEELSFQRATDVEANGDQGGADPETEEDADSDAFEEEFSLHMTEPTDDESSGSTVLPLLVRGPADMSESAIRKIDLARSFDEKAIELRENALSRVLNGIDIPKDLVTGLSQVRYSNAQQIDENLYKAHVEPAAVTLCEAVTVTRLRPALVARGFPLDKVARVVCWYDASEVVTNANRSQDADAGHDRLLISDAAWRRDHGYAEADAPDDEELTRRLAQKNPLAPETSIQMLAALMPLIGEMAKMHQIVLNPSAGAPGGGGSPSAPANGFKAIAPAGGGGAPAGSSGGQPPPEGSPAPVVAAAQRTTKADADIRRLLDVERKLRTSLQMMLTDMTERALEKAGSRLTSKVRGNPELSAKIKDVPKTMVASVLGRDAVVAAGYTDQQLVNDSVNETEPKYKQQIAQAQAQAARILGLPEFGTPDGIDHSWSLLKPLLLAYMTRALFRKRENEYVPKLPMDDIRMALARAGGSMPMRPAQDGPQPGAVLNQAAFDMLAEKHDAEHAGYRWIYGISDNHFQPHLDLDGKAFMSWTDPVLRNPGTFPKVQFLHPGDHGGCECDWLPNYVPKQPHEGRVPEHVEGAA